MAAIALTYIGNTVAGPLGAIAGNLLGTYIDRAVFGSGRGTINREETGPRLSDLFVTSSTEGSPIPRVLGRMRLSPQLIWATNFREVVKTSTSTQESGGGGGKGGGGGGGSQAITTTTTTYHYFCSFALGLCEGPIADVAGVWADGKRLDLSQYNTRLYKGTETQTADPKIQAVEGTDNAPAFRGLAYLVFEEMPLEKFGNRLPQLTVEVIRQPTPTGVRIEDAVTGVAVIPTLGEFAYATDSVYRNDGFGHTIPENRHGSASKADLLVSLDQLQSSAPNVTSVALVVAWHGDDLRCGQCTIRPKVEFGASKVTTPWSWIVSGTGRAAALVVSTDADGALLGGAPSDRSVFQAIAELKDRGFAVILYPFIIMDIPPGNTLPNPYSDNAAAIGQPVFPWRGRISISPAAGFVGTADETAAAAAQIADFFGTAAAVDYGAWNGDTIPYSGPNEWRYRRFILHYATLGAAAGIDAFLIGSEMRGLTTARSDASTFPAVVHFTQLAADVSSILGAGVKVGYAADWTEYANYRPADGSGDVFFHLDPLYADANIDFVGIDNYLPMSDWREGRQHLDAQAGAPSIYDIGYLQSQIEGGELYDYYYATDADRETQTRTPIDDSSDGEHWVFRYKDIRNWWANPHHNRPGGVRDVTPTAWVPESKPIWFTEFGCPAIDKGTNQPNVFSDPKSSEDFVPYFSSGRRDDLIQRAYYEAVTEYWKPSAGNNPVSSVYGERMIDTARLIAWTWDARPYPQFPNNTLVWRDGPNWRRGHWLNGRLGLVSLADAVNEICAGLGVPIDTAGLNGIVRGYMQDRIMSARSALQQLMQLYFFDAIESGGAIKFVHRGGPIVATFTDGNIVNTGSDRGLYMLTRAQETDLPRTAHLKFHDPDADYQVADVYSRRLKGSNAGVVELTAAMALDFGEAQGMIDNVLVDTHVMRERAELTLPPSSYRYEPTDIVSLEVNGRAFEMRIEELGLQHFRPARLVRTDAATYGVADGAPSMRQPAPSIDPGPVVLRIMDLPILDQTEVPGVPRLAAYAEPWARCAAYRSPIATGYRLDQLIVNRSTIGKTTADFYSGPLWRWDMVNDLYVQISETQGLESLDEELVLAGANTCAVQNAEGEWEVLQFATVTQTSPTTYKLSRLLRGQLGSEYAMRSPVATGAPFVMLSGNAQQSLLAVSERGNPWNFRWGPATKTLDDPTFQTLAFTPKAVGLRPYSPVQLKGCRDADTMVWTLSWIRRSRISGDNWENADVPLGEEVELYDVEIIDPVDGETIKHTAQVGTPEFHYSSAMQVADFGGNQTTILFRVFQVSIGYGRGTPGQNQVYS